MAEHLIDISGWNTVTDWRSVQRDGIVGASIKTTQATNYVNPLAPAQAAGARSVDIAAGAYHFGDPRFGARAQAEYFVRQSNAVGLLAPGSLAPMYDVENWTEGGLVWQSHQQITDYVGVWIELLVSELDIRRGFVYGSQSWFTGGWIRPDDLAVPGFDLMNWVAVFNGDPGNTAPWADARDGLHQHTSQGIVPGVAGYVDKNVTLTGRTLPELTIGTKGVEDVTGAEVWGETLESGLGYRARASEWLTETSARAERNEATSLRIEAQLAALTGSLTQGQAEILAAVQLDADGGMTDEQVDRGATRMAMQLQTTLPPAFILALGRSLLDRPIGETGMSTRAGDPVPEAVVDQWATASSPETAGAVPEQARGVNP